MGAGSSWASRGTARDGRAGRERRWNDPATLKLPAPSARGACGCERAPPRPSGSQVTSTKRSPKRSPASRSAVPPHSRTDTGACDRLFRLQRCASRRKREPGTMQRPFSTASLHRPDPDSADSMRALNTSPRFQETSTPHKRSTLVRSPPRSPTKEAPSPSETQSPSIRSPSITITELSAPG